MNRFEPDQDALALTDARANFTDLVNKAEFQHRSTLITRHGRAAARIVPPADTGDRDAMCSHQDELDYWRYRHADVATWLDEGWETHASGSAVSGMVLMPRDDKVMRAMGDLAQIALTGPFLRHPTVNVYMTHLTCALAELQDRQIAMYAHEAVRAGSSFNYLAIRTNRDTAELAARWTEWSWQRATSRDPDIRHRWRAEHYEEHAAIADTIGRGGWRQLWDDGLNRYTNGTQDVPNWRTILDSRPHSKAEDPVPIFPNPQ